MRIETICPSLSATKVSLKFAVDIGVVGYCVRRMFPNRKIGMFLECECLESVDEREP
jgi:hypothetical protein